MCIDSEAYRDLSLLVPSVATTVSQTDSVHRHPGIQRSKACLYRDCRNHGVSDSVHRHPGIQGSKACLYLMSQPRCLRQTVYTDIQAYRDLRPACTETAATTVSQTIVPQAIPATVSRLQTRLTGSWRNKVRMLCRLISIYNTFRDAKQILCIAPLHAPRTTAFGDERFCPRLLRKTVERKDS